MVRDCRHGFFRGKSCTSNLLEVLDHVGSLVDDGKQVDMIYMDMSKALSHEITVNRTVISIKPLVLSINAYSNPKVMRTKDMITQGGFS